MRWNVDINTAQLLFQIKNLYSSGGSFGNYDLVYDRVKKDGHDMKYSPEELADIWERSKKEYALRNKKLIPRLSKEELKKEVTKVFKSILVAKYLMSKVKEEGCLIISDEEGNKLEIPQPFK